MSISILVPHSLRDQKVFFNTEYNIRYFPQKMTISMKFMWNLFPLQIARLFYCFSTVINIKVFNNTSSRKRHINNLCLPKGHLVRRLSSDSHLPPVFQLTKLLHWVSQRKFRKKKKKLCNTKFYSNMPKTYGEKHLQWFCKWKRKTKKKSSYCIYKFITGRKSLKVFLWTC